ncbi:MAG: Asp-tRNA(Asn)/Glu-tRNA(Gln) amidotransferase subunit GatC [Candidatus Omnitrophota bacterium]|jgi:aspartyl-tRNA(Asn)/glutamyl-tRNA(Gln) amidotransferase subunit C
MSDKEISIITEENVKYVAHLARMELSPERLPVLAHQLKDILDFIDKLKEADITGVLPTSHILPIQNVLREDLFKGSLSSQDALANAPDKQGDFFGVPKVIE